MNLLQLAVALREIKFMEIMQTIVFVLNILSAVSVVILVLMQHGKGADMGTGFGSGSAGGLFGSSGSANFLSRTTAFCAIIFFATCFTLAVMMSPKQISTDFGVMQSSVAASQMSTAAQQSKIPD